MATLRFETNEFIQFRHSSHTVRQIVAVRDTGYSWRFPYGDTNYSTEGTIDPFLEDGWHTVDG